MKRFSFYTLIIALTLLVQTVKSQNFETIYDNLTTIEIDVPVFLENIESCFDFSFLNTTDSYYNVELIRSEFNDFESSINMEMEDEPFYENGVKMLRNFIYLNLNLHYSIGKFGLSFSINNLFNFNNSEFSIIPELYRANNVIQDFYLVHDHNFSIQTVIAYTF